MSESFASDPALDAGSLAALYPVPVAAAVGPCAPVDECLFPEERRHVERAVAGRRAEFLAVRERAREALASLGGPRVALVPNADRSPTWPAGFVGSLSHSRALCAAVVAREAHALALGLDLEPDGPLDADLVATVCTPAERRAIEAAAPATGLRLAKRLFSAKEAFYKCQYPVTGAFLTCAQVELALEPRTGAFRVARVDLAGERGRLAARVRGRCTALGGHVVSAAALTSPSRAETGPEASRAPDAGR